jgi:hypothetical protein
MVEKRRLGEPLLLAVFFVSGVSALIYQVAWQRLLFAAVIIMTMGMRVRI